MGGPQNTWGFTWKICHLQRELHYQSHSHFQNHITYKQCYSFLWPFGFTPCKGEQPLQEKEEEDEKEDEKHVKKLSRKKVEGKRYLLTFDLKPIRYSIKEKHSLGKELQSLAVWGKKLNIDILLVSRNDERRIMQPIRITSRPAMRRRKWNWFIQFRWTSPKVVPIGKT